MTSSLSSAALCVVVCNFPSEDSAAQIARTLVEENLAACVNVLTQGVRSIYRWRWSNENGESEEGQEAQGPAQDAIQDEREVMALMKTTPQRLPALRARLTALHPYEIPEIVALPVPADAVNDDYLAWVRSSL